MRPSISIWGFVRPSVGRSVGPSVRRSVRRSVRPSETHSLNSSKFDILPISTERKWTRMINDVHKHPNNGHNDHNDHHNYHNDRNKTTKKRRRIFVRQNLLNRKSTYISTIVTPTGQLQNLNCNTPFQHQNSKIVNQNPRPGKNKVRNNSDAVSSFFFV